ncbi:MAG: glycosyltransferase [Cyanobacteria bacterium P01_H01_bin.35]
MIKCKICDSICLNFAQAQILNKKYKIDYFQCQNCNFIQTEYPYWLTEAYTQAIASSDEGLIFRNLMLSQITKNLIDKLFNPEGKFLDFGGGYGLFSRLMRDIKYKFYWQDKYCKNLFAQNLKATPNQKYELVTVFEVLEHLVNPIAEIKEILNYSSNILFSTEILPTNNPKPDQWWYYALNEGQHISIYTVKSLQIIAQKFHLNLYTNYSSLHLLTEKKISSAFCEALLKYDAENLRQTLRQNRDYLKTFQIIFNKEEVGSKREEANSRQIQKSRQKFAQLPDETPFLQKEEGGNNRQEANFITMEKSPQKFIQLPEERNSIQIPKSSKKSVQVSDKTAFLQKEEGENNRQETNSIPMPKSPQKFAQLPDKTPFLEKEQERKTKQNKIPQIPEKMSDTTLSLPTQTTPQKLGINIAGFVKGELGIGEGVRATLRAIETTNIPFVINNIISTPHRNSDTTYHKFTQENPHPINLFQVNANEVKTFLKKPTVKQYFANKYNIGFWAWELPKFPPEWIGAFTPFNEIWTYSNYCAESISMVSPIPVIKMMPSINLPIPKIGRKELDLPTDKFIFLFIFDFFSRLERKNPLATITAFKKAFGNSNQNVLLLIKSSNSERFPNDKSRLINSIQDSSNIKHIDGYLSKEKINALLYNCNCYVSLHRAEGFGLTMAEAMFYGKPVIATGYSSNTEFMNVGNSFLVDYEKVEISDNYGPYKQGDIWANPNIEHCANLMKYVFNNYRQAEKIGLKASQDIKLLLSPETIGKKIKTRLEYIAKITENFTNIPATKLSQPSPIKKLPLVSICIPTYNGENFIRAAINTAISQTYSNLEIIISDDKSSDKTIEIVKTLQSENPQIDFQIISHQNYGLVGNLNFCISLAKGKYIKFLLQDDLLEPNCIEELVKLAETDSEIGLVFSRRRVILEPGAENNSTCVAAYRGTQDLHKDWSNLKTIQSGKDLLLDSNLMKYRLNKIGEPTTVLIPKAVFEKIGIFDSDLSQVLDIDMWLRIMGNYKIGFVDQTLSQLRIHPCQQTQRNLTSGKNAQDYQRFYQKILENSVYNFLAIEVKETVRQKLGFLLKQDFAQLANLVEQYRRYPADESVLNSLRKLRLQFAEKLLGLSNEQLKYFYQAEIGRIYKLLFNSGMKNEVLTASEKEFVANLQKNFSATNILQSILAFLLYRFAFQLPINYRQAALPKWIFTDFLDFLFARPLNFQEVGELEKYCEYVKDLIVYLKGNVFSNSNFQVRENIAAFLSNDFDLTILYCCDFPVPNIWQNMFQVRKFFLECNGYQLDYSFPEIRNNNHKIRLGILLDKLSFQQDTFTVISILENLDRHNFEIVLYYFSITNDILGFYCQKADLPKKMSVNLSESVNTIRTDRLDILLVATNLTNTPNPFFNLASHRLAPVQVSTNPIPTSLRNFDYCIVGEKTLPEAPETHKQITLPGSGLCLTFPPPIITIKPTRASWGANPETIVFISGAKPNQIHPEQRQTWANIMAAVPNSILVLCPYHFSPQDYDQILLWKQMRALSNDFGLDENRIIVIKNLKSRSDFSECLKLANIYLDAFGSTELVSVVESLLVGVPTVFKNSETFRGKQTSALLKELELPELITHTEKEYINLTVALATDQKLCCDYREKIQQKILSNPQFLDSHSYAKQIGRIFKKMINNQHL